MHNRIPYIKNKIKFENFENYCAILGESPSKGARSPLLWNRCFDEFKIPCYFYPLDVKETELENLIHYLKADSNFLGGAVTVPHKERIIEFLDDIEEEANLIGAVNLIYKKGGELVGANTDGLGAIASIAEKMDLGIENFAVGKKALVIGTGGTAKACAVYMSKSIGHTGMLFIAGRNKDKAEKIAEKCSQFSKTTAIAIEDIDKSAGMVDFVINCTVVGFAHCYSSEGQYFYLEPFSPLAHTPSKGFDEMKPNAKDIWLREFSIEIGNNWIQAIEVLKKFSKEAILMDVIYEPDMTIFLKMAQFFDLGILNGQRMNLLQAAYGFIKVFPDFEDKIEHVTHCMQVA